MLVNFPSPHPETPARPSTPKVLRTKERASTLYFFVIFTLYSHLSLSKNLGAHQYKSFGNILCPILSVKYNEATMFLLDEFMYMLENKISANKTNIL
jgi:hypothetical protein